jgi:hypothetical protein
MMLLLMCKICGLLAFFFDDENIFVGAFHVIMFPGVLFLGEFKIFGFLACFLDFVFVKLAIIFQALLRPEKAVLRPEAVSIKEYEDKKKDHQREIVAILKRLR